MSKLRSAGIFLGILFLLIGTVNFLIWTDWGSHIDTRLSSNFILGLASFSAAFSLLYLSTYYHSAPTEPIPPSPPDQSLPEETKTQQLTPAEKQHTKTEFSTTHL
jgi:hypothetical protein